MHIGRVVFRRLLRLRKISDQLVPHFSSVSAEVLEPSRTRTVAWIQSIRRHKTKTFFNVNDGTSPSDLQVVCSTCDIPNGLSVGSAICVDGQIVVRQIGSKEFSTELRADQVQLLSPLEISKSEGGETAIGVMSHSRPRLGLLRSNKGLFWRHRLPEMAAMLRLRAVCKSIVHQTMQARGYLEVDAPILTMADCEGAGETFLVVPTSERSKETRNNSEPPEELANLKIPRSTLPLHLSVSAQLHLEALAIGMNKVYTLSPTFRAEPSHSRFHLAEFLMLEAESVAMATTEALCDEVEAIVRQIANLVLEMLVSVSSRQKDLGLVLSFLSESPDSANAVDHLNSLESIIKRPFTRMTFHEALSLLDRLGKRTTASETSGFNKEEEQALCASVGNSGVFVTDFPSAQKPFYCAASSKDAPTSAAVDFLIPGVGEIVGGSIRETDRERLLERMPGGGLGTLGWYADLRGHGSAPHGGFGLGFDRMLLWLLGVYNIRDTVTFPREIGKTYL